MVSRNYIMLNQQMGDEHHIFKFCVTNLVHVGSPISMIHTRQTKSALLLLIHVPLKVNSKEM